MIRKKYKTLYEKEKADKETIMRILNFLINELKTWKDIEITDEIIEMNVFEDKIRKVMISKGKDWCFFSINQTLLNEEGENND